MKRLLISFLFFVLCSMFLIWQTVLRDQSILSFNERRAAFQERWATVFGLGRPFPDLRLSHKGLDLQSADAAKGNWSLYLFSPHCDEAVLSYPLVLLERYRQLGFNLFCILPSPIAEKIQAPNRPFFRMLTDLHGELQSVFESLGQDAFEGVALADPQGVVQFSVPYRLKPEILRQLVERFLLGQVSYRLESALKGFAPGVALPDLELRRLSDGQTLPLSEVVSDRATVIFFRAYCATCLLKPNLERFRELIEQGTDFGKERILLIFSKAHLLEEIRFFASDDPSWPEIYRAEDYATGWEDPYNTIPDQRNPSTVVQTVSGRISHSMTFIDWYLERIQAL